jgi:hypothetical protein
MTVLGVGLLPTPLADAVPAALYKSVNAQLWQRVGARTIRGLARWGGRRCPRLVLEVEELAHVHACGVAMIEVG